MIESFKELTEECAVHSTWLQGASSEIRKCFNMIQKHSISSDEMLTYYQEVWIPFQMITRNIENATVKEKDKFKKDCRERILILGRSAFIDSLSIVEYFMKVTIEESTEGPLVDWAERIKGRQSSRLKRLWRYLLKVICRQKGRKRVYLSGILRESKRKKMIDGMQHRSWRGMIELRNAMVHNNAIADRNITLTIGDMSAKTYTGKMIQLSPRKYPEVIKVLVSLTRVWIEAYLRFHTV